MLIMWFVFFFLSFSFVNSFIRLCYKNRISQQERIDFLKYIFIYIDIYKYKYEKNVGFREMGMKLKSNSAMMRMVNNNDIFSLTIMIRFVYVVVRKWFGIE